MDSPSRQFSLLSSTGEGEEGGSSGRTLHFNLAMEELEDDFFDGAKKWRLNRDQVKFLETSFAMENKLESTRKSLIASKLGIHPRKVAVWFQNRRARRKTKQLESDFHALKRHYDSALKEKENLKSQISRLVALLDDQTHRMLPATLEPIIGPGNNAKNDETSSSIAPSPPSNLTSTNERGYDLSTMDDTTHGVVVGCTMDGAVMGHVDTLLVPSDSYGYNYEYDYEGLQLGADMYNINHNKKKEGGSIVVEGDPYNNPIPMAWDDCSLFLWFD